MKKILNKKIFALLAVFIVLSCLFIGTKTASADFIDTTTNLGKNGLFGPLYGIYSNWAGNADNASDRLTNWWQSGTTNAEAKSRALNEAAAKRAANPWTKKISDATIQRNIAENALDSAKQGGNPAAISEAQQKYDAADQNLQQTQQQALNDPVYKQLDDDYKAKMAESSNADAMLGKGCGITNIPACVTQVLSWIVKMLLAFCALILAFAGDVFDAAIKFAIVEMPSNINNFVSINYTWVFLRDIANIFFIFILLYIGIRTIIGSGGYDTKKILVTVIIVALLINFSLFLTKIVIDASNVLASVFVNLTSGGTGISAVYANKISLGDIYKTYANPNAPIDGSKIISIGIFGSLLFLITAFVFFAGAGLILIRFVYLIVLMILSPLAFILMILPGTKKFWDMWLQNLLAQSFFAPIFLMCTWIVLTIVQTSNIIDLRKNSDLAQNSLPTSLFIINFVIIIALSLVGLILAKKMGAYGAATIMAWGNKARIGATRMLGRATGAATIGLAGYGLRNTVGKAAYRVSESDTLRDKAAQGGWGGMLARTALRTSKGVASSSFDARAISKTSQKVLGGPAGKGGFRGYVDEKVKTEKKYAKDLGKGDIYKKEDGTYVSSASLKQQAIREVEKRGDIKSGTDEFDKEVKKAHEAKIAALGKTTKMSRQEVYAKENLQKGSLLQRTYASLTSPANIITGGLGLFNSARRQRSYKIKFIAHVKAAEAIIKDAKKAKNKNEIGKLESEKRNLQRKIDSMNIENARTEKEKKKLEEERDAATDPTVKSAKQSAIDKKQKDIDDNKKLRDIEEDKLSKIENDIDDAKAKDEPEKKDEGDKSKKTGE